MGNINTLTQRVKELEDQLAVCIRCGMCQSVCPLFDTTGKETDVARGKLALLSGLITQIFSDPDGVNERLNRCLLCGSCAANCPSNVNVLEIFIQARAILSEYKGLSLIKKIVFKQMLSNPKIFNTLIAWASKFQDLILKSNKNEQGTSCARIVSPLLKNRHFMPISKHPFHKTLNKEQLGPNNATITVLLFTGCLIDKILPQIAQATVTALAHHNVRVIIPETQGCCGIPALSSGDRNTFNFLVGYHLDLFKEENFDYLVTACATCTSTIKKMWPTLVQRPDMTTDNEKSRQTYLQDLAKRTMDINEFLVDVMKVDKVQQVEQSLEPVTYHDPCHLKKSLGIDAQPRQLITTAGHPIQEMEDADKCCGMGGSFNLFHYDLSSQIGQLKSENIIDTQCSIAASGCPACMIQISDMLSKEGATIKVKHPIELYANSLKTPI